MPQKLSASKAFFSNALEKLSITGTMMKRRNISYYLGVLQNCLVKRRHLEQKCLQNCYICKKTLKEFHLDKIVLPPHVLIHHIRNLILSIRSRERRKNARKKKSSIAACDSGRRRRRRLPPPPPPPPPSAAAALLPRSTHTSLLRSRSMPKTCRSLAPQTS